MRLPALPIDLPGPRDVFALVERLTGLLGTAEGLLATASRLVTSADRLLGSVDDLILRVELTRAEAGLVVERTEMTRKRADVLLGELEPVVADLLPMLERLAATTSPREVDALVGLINHLPMLVGKLETDVLPMLETLSSVAPDLHDLLDTSRELNEMLGKLPGMGRIKAKVEERQAEEDGSDSP